MVTLKSQELSQGLTLSGKSTKRVSKRKNKCLLEAPGYRKCCPSWEKRPAAGGEQTAGQGLAGAGASVLTPGRSGRGGPGPEARAPDPRGWEQGSAELPGIFREQGSAELPGSLRPGGQAGSTASLAAGGKRSSPFSRDSGQGSPCPWRGTGTGRRKAAGTAPRSPKLRQLTMVSTEEFITARGPAGIERNELC